MGVLVILILILILVTNENKVNPRFCLRLLLGFDKKEERLNNGDNNGQAMHGARKHAWGTQAAWANYTGRLNT